MCDKGFDVMELARKKGIDSSKHYNEKEVMPNSEALQLPPVPVAVIVENGVENFIEQGCIKACQRLWDLNIDTFESSFNPIYPYAYITFANLDEHNQKIFNEQMELYPDNYGFITYKRVPGIKVPLNNNAEELLLNLANVFVQQDIIPYAIENTQVGYLPLENFLMFQKCATLSIGDDGSIIREFAPEKMTKSLEEYLSDAEASELYVPEEKRVYTHKYYLDKHMDYIKKSTVNNSDLSM